MKINRGNRDEAIKIIHAHPDFKELVRLAESYYPKCKANPYRLLGMEQSELAYSELLAYFLDSTQDHGLGTLLFAQWNQHLKLSSPDWGKVREVRVFTEWRTSTGRAIDLVLETKWDKLPLFVVGIENKINANESNEQLGDYQSALARTYPNGEKSLIFLTPDGRDPKTSTNDIKSVKVRPASWVKIHTVLNGILTDNSERIEPSVRWALTQLLEFMCADLQPVRKKILGDAKEVMGKMTSDETTKKAIDLIKAEVAHQLTTRNLFYERVLRELRNRHPLAEIESHYPDDSANPYEFKFELRNHRTSDSIRNDGFVILITNHIGSHAMKNKYDNSKNDVYTYIMAYNRDGRYKNTRETKSSLREKWKNNTNTPISNISPKDEWGPWVCLWTGGRHKIRDMSWNDGTAIADNLAEAFDIAIKAGIIIPKNQMYPPRRHGKSE